jgi:hypothetical protein
LRGCPFADDAVGLLHLFYDRKRQHLWIKFLGVFRLEARNDSLLDLRKRRAAGRRLGGQIQKIVQTAFSDIKKRLPRITPPWPPMTYSKSSLSTASRRRIQSRR